MITGFLAKTAHIFSDGERKATFFKYVSVQQGTGKLLDVNALLMTEV